MENSYITPCITNNKRNIFSYNGSLALTLLKEKYFDGDFTTATIISKTSFNLTEFGTKLVIKFRAAFRKDLGIYPQILLLSDKTIESILSGKESYTKFLITILNYGEGKIWNGLWSGYDTNNISKWENYTGNIDFNEFQEFQFESFNKTYKWRLNEKE